LLFGSLTTRLPVLGDTLGRLLALIVPLNVETLVGSLTLNHPSITVSSATFSVLLILVCVEFISTLLEVPKVIPLPCAFKLIPTPNMFTLLLPVNAEISISPLLVFNEIPLVVNCILVFALLFNLIRLPVNPIFPASPIILPFLVVDGGIVPKPPIFREASFPVYKTFNDILGGCYKPEYPFTLTVKLEVSSTSAG